ncbi:biopolymer transporter ExbD [Campylobacter corcagiensis]|uniref:Biopolymer transporter ExbD n=1 Tax=Campylobacter corcagiensis TaxID=1448857 RepID=A0A7M1LHU6_9BACT|nr:biopolymer transporter ExbD [Campylobacter corcagiensis]QKF65243.1 Tol-Pal system subunit TolR [Campylobacter corcagiensis]QOQ88159.1 biopolymer transporter ExbD [Campylobacter corcagiensis]
MYDFDEKPELNITPLVDIMLVLLAILMVTTPAVIYEENILLPIGSKKQISTEKTEDLVVRVTPDKIIDIAGSKMSFDEFGDNLILLISKYNLQAPVYIQADKTLLYDDVVFVLKTLKKAGFSKVSLQTLG